MEDNTEFKPETNFVTDSEQPSAPQPNIEDLQTQVTLLEGKNEALIVDAVNFDEVKKSFESRNLAQAEQIGKLTSELDSLKEGLATDQLTNTNEEIISLRADRIALENQLINLGAASSLKTALETLAKQDRPDNEKIHLRRAINTLEL